MKGNGYASDWGWTAAARGDYRSPTTGGEGPMLRWLMRLLGLGKAPPIDYGIPTVEFDPKLVTKAVKDDLKKNIRNLPDFDKSHFDKVYSAALRSIFHGRALGMLSDAIIALNVPGMTKERAVDITRKLHNQATAMINKERHLKLGITEFIWMDSKARDCEVARRYDGKKFSYLHPPPEGLPGSAACGMEGGCICVSRPVIPGFN